MIGRIRGLLLEKSPPFVLVEAGGVGYEIQVPMMTYYRLPEPGQEVSLCTHLSVSENLHALYGFASLSDRQLFRDLIKVSGVGPKLGLAILSGMEADDFVRSVHDGNVDQLVRLPGVGKKTAERLVVEMRDRLKDWQLPDLPGTTGEAPVVDNRGAVQEAVAALVALGYKPQIASRAISRVESDASGSEELIRLALKQLANG